MQLLDSEVVTYSYVPDDESESAAVRVMHRTSRQEVVCCQTPSQCHNFRLALFGLIAKMNPHPDHIPRPKLMLFDEVRVNLPQSIHEGRITRLSWDFTRGEWQYYVQCPKEVVSTWYISADLQLLEQDDD